MKTSSFTALLLLAATLGSGCSTINSRIQNNTDVYASLEPETWEKLQEGRVELGYTPEMVRIALGSPDETQQHVADGGRHEIWMYRAFYHDYLNPNRIGFRRYIVNDQQSGQPVAYFEPVSREAYQALGLAQRDERFVQISFEDARVVGIDSFVPPPKEN